LIGQKDIPNIFFYDLYLNLKKEKGFELDITNFETFLHVFVSGKWMNEGDSEQIKIKKLKNLCRTLWVQRTKMNVYFEHHFDRSLKYWLDKQIKEKEDTIKDEEDINKGNSSNDISNETQEESTNNNDKEEEDNGTKKLPETENPNNEVETGKEDFLEFFLEFSQGGGSSVAIPEIVKEQEIPFIFSDEKFLPFNHRRVQQLWKKVKHNVVKVEGNRINIKSTLEHFIKDRYISKPKYHLENSGNINFYLFIENGGPMEAYYKLSESLYKDLLASDKNNHVHKFFFTNYPIEIEITDKGRKELAFFKNRNATEVITMSNLGEKIKHPSCILFFSDAGALDNKMNNKRINLTVKTLESLKKYSQNILWINPVLERERWRGTSASYISLFCKMIPYTFKGLEEAIKNLRD